MPNLTVNWVKNTNNNQWFDLLRLNLDAPYFQNREGVYMIWYAGAAEAKNNTCWAGTNRSQAKRT